MGKRVKKLNRIEPPVGALTAQQGRHITGRLYEGWAATLFGGQRIKVNPSNEFCPDVVVPDERWLLEAKGWSRKASSLLWLSQVDGYGSEAGMMSREAGEEWEAFYIIFRHGVYGYGAKSKRTEQSHGFFFNAWNFVQALLETTEHAVILPIRLVGELAERGRTSTPLFPYKDEEDTERVYLPSFALSSAEALCEFLKAREVEFLRASLESHRASLMDIKLPSISTHAFGNSEEIGRIVRRLSAKRSMTGTRYMLGVKYNGDPLV